METPSESDPKRARRRRDRFLAVLIGLALCAVLLGGSNYWMASYVDGQETCSACGLLRDVDRRGPIWFRSEPYASRMLAKPAASCPDHDWVKSGCWREDGSWIRYAAVVPNR